MTNRMLPSDPVVRQMRPDEFAVVRALQVDAFGGDAQIGDLLDLLRSSWAWDEQLSFVIELDGRLAGHVLYSHALLDAPQRLVDVLVLGPVGVLPELHGQQLGSLLIEVTLRQLHGRPEPLVFVEGHPGYYPRFGFRRAGAMGFIPPSYRIPDDAFMVLSLPGYAPWMRGALVYPDPFWRADAVGLRDPAQGAGVDAVNDE